MGGGRRSVARGSIECAPSGTGQGVEFFTASIASSVRNGTVRGFGEILDGKHDDLPEAAFYMVGTIDEAVEAADRLRSGD